jgi:tetratricopeptide (TPR) repeat protein
MRRGSRTDMAAPHGPVAPAGWRLRTLLLAVLLPALFASGAAPETAKNGNRIDGVLDVLIAGIVKDPASVRAYLDVIETIRLWDVATPGKVESSIDRIASLKNLGPQARMIVPAFRIAALSRKGSLSKASSMLDSSGILTRWLTIGPFDNEDLKGQERAMGPEIDRGEPFSMSLAYEGDERPVNWRTARADPLSGVLDLARFLYPAEKVCGFAGTYVESDKNVTALVWGSSSGTLALWVDGAKVVQDPVYRDFGPMRHAAQVKLSKGTHQIMAKVCVVAQAWRLEVQLTTPKGAPLVLKSDADPEALKKPYARPAKDPAWEPFETALAKLAALAEDESDAAAAGEYARFLFLTGSDDQIAAEAPDLAERAAQASASCRDDLTLALTTDDENRAYGAIKTCLDREPGNADAAYLLLTQLRDILSFPDYAGEAAWAARRFPADPLIALIGIDVLEDSGMPLTAFAELKKLRDRFGDLPVVMERLMGMAQAAAPQAEQDALIDALLQTAGDNLDVRTACLKRFLNRGDTEGARKELETLVTFFWTSESAVQLAASEYVAMKDWARAEAIFTAETERSPHDPAVWEALGLFYNLTGEAAMALTCFQTVLQLNPQNVEVRQYIASLKPEEKFETAYIKDEAFIRQLAGTLKTKAEKEGDLFATEDTDLSILVEQEVDRVYENGTSSRFVQETVRINTEQGAKLQRYQFIGYSPTRQDLIILRSSVLHPDGSVEEAAGRFTVPIVEEQYRLYYDDANEIIEMPSLKPGDIVDIQYKLSDAGVRNMFERHYGNVVSLQSLYPRIFFRYAIIADKAVKLHEDTPGWPGLKHGTKEGDGTVTTSWEASRIPPIIPEPEMPPVQELTPLIRVSTFGTWEEFGTWWWALASPQMVVDKAIKEKVKELVKGKKKEEEKIAAVFDWVIRSTRYVGLEFGIHGFKPYRTTEVVSRGFGDCKDKATLLYVMLEEAGVDAAIALVRTRGSGNLPSSFPFQFLFDHAIAAVPSRNLYLDGTVDYLGYQTLPSGDQDVFSLLLSEGKVETRQTPVMPAQDTRQEITIELALDAGGDAVIAGKVLAAGAVTSHYRDTYQTTGTRKERLEEELAGIFPGVSVLSHDFKGLEDFSQDVQVEFTASVPGLAMVSQSQMQLTAMPSYNLSKTYASRSKRTYPVLIGQPRVFIDHYVVKAPEGMTFSSLPSTVMVGSKPDGYFFTFAVTKVESSTIEMEAILEISTFRIEPDGYAAFREFCRKVDEATSQRIHIEKIAKAGP